MQRIALARGTRAEVLGELNQLGEDAAQAGKADKARGYAAAWHQIDEGDTVVEVGRNRYEVTD